DLTYGPQPYRPGRHIQFLLAKLDDGETGNTDHDPARALPHGREHSAWSGTVPEDGVLEVSRLRGPRRRAVRQDPDRQQGRSDPPVRLLERIALHVRRYEPRPLQDLHDGTRRHPDAVVCRRYQACGWLGFGPLPANDAAAEDPGAG